MPLFKRKNNKEQNSKNKNEKTTKQGFGRPASSSQHGQIISQQDTQFDVNPSFFNYEKVKLNHFLTDDKEYNRKKLVDDCPSGNPAHLDINEDYVDIMKRFKKDESAFSEVFFSMNVNKKQSEMQMDSTRASAIYNIEQLDKEEIRHPIRTRNIDAEFYSKIGHALNKESEVVGKKTHALLKQMHTKVLDLNHINQFPINRKERYEQGGYQTTKEYAVTDDGVNKYRTLVKTSKVSIVDEKTKSKYDGPLTRQERDDLYTIKEPKPKHDRWSTRDINNEYIERRNRNIENEFVAPRKQFDTNELLVRQSGESFTNPEKNTVYTKEFVSNATRQLNLFKEDEKYKAKKPTLSMENNKTFNDLLSDSIQEKVHKHQQERTKIMKEFDVIQKQDTVSYSHLVPINEVKLDLRIRKSEKRDFKFVPKA